MATTTNYSWTTPDDTDLVKDGAAAIRSLGTSIDTTTKNLNPSTTLGDIEYRSSTANTNTRLGIGTTGQVLTVAAGVPSWSNVVSGKVLQVVNATYNTETTSSTSTYIDSGLSASITPTSATSKVLVIAFLDCQKENNSWIKSKLVRGATDLVTMGTQSGATSSAVLNNIGSVGITYQDSPATTSATTYKVQFASASNNAVVSVQAGSGRSSITLMEIGA